MKKHIFYRKTTQSGQPAPIFLKRDSNGKEISLSSFRGKDYVLLDFWASWCVPCREMTPALKAAYQKFHAKGLAIVSISWDLKRLG